MEVFNQIWRIIVSSNLLGIIGAVAALLAGWLISLFISRKVTQCIRKFRKKKDAGGKECPVPGNADTLAGRIIFYFLMLIVVAGCLSILEINAAAGPIQDFLSEVAKYAPNAAGAVILSIAAWIVAGVAGGFTKSVVKSTKLYEKIGNAAEKKDPENIAQYIGKTVYCTVLLFFLPAILSALKIKGITAPLQTMLAKLLTFIPNLLAAAVILLAGLLAAGIIRRAVSGLVVITRLEELGEKIGVSRTFGSKGLSSMAGIAAYALVAIPVVISSLTALQINVLSSTLASFFNKLLNGTGDIIGAMLILFAAVIAGGFLSSIAVQLTANFGFDRFMENLGFHTSGEKKSMAPSEIAGKLIFIAILLLAVLAACDVLGFRQLSLLIRSLAVFGGNILLSIVVVLIGVWIADFTAKAVKGKCPDAVTGGIRGAIIIFTCALAISNIGIGGQIAEVTFTLILGAFCVAFAIAFGIGGRDAAAKILQSLTDKLKK